jgi:hypothetical protein
MIVPVFFKDPDFLTSLFPSRRTIHPELSLALFRFYLTCRTFTDNIDAQWIQQHVFPLFQEGVHDVARRACIMAAAETAVPYGQAALSLFDKLNAGSHPGVVFASRKLAALLGLPVGTGRDVRDALRRLVRCAHAEPAGRPDAELFGELVDRARAARAEDPWKRAADAPKHTAGGESLVFWRFRAAEAPKTDGRKIEESDAQFKKIPLLKSPVVDFFRPLADREPPDAEIPRGWPVFNVLVIGPPARMLSVLNGYLGFVVAQESPRFSRNLAFVPIPRRAGTRLTDLLGRTDVCYRLTAGQVDRFLSSTVPRVDLEKWDCRIADLPDPAKYADPWSAPVSPYHLLQRFLTFYCDCATVVTEVPVWEVTLICGQGRFTTTGCLCGIDVAPVEEESGGTIDFRLLGPGENEFRVSATGLQAVAFPLPAERQVNTVEDESLVLTLAGAPREFGEPMVITNVRGEWTRPRVVCVDAVEFADVSVFSVDRFTHQQSKINFPVRTFAGLDSLTYCS